MNVLIIKDNDKKIEEYSSKLESISNINSKNIINFYFEKTPKLKIDIYLIISNEIEFIEEYFNSIKSKENILIITNKFEPKHILSCLLLSENLFSLKKGEEYILNKINYVYETNKEREISKRRILNAKS